MRFQFGRRVIKLDDLRDEDASGLRCDLVEVHLVAPEFQFDVLYLLSLSHEDIDHNSRPKIKAMNRLKLTAKDHGP